MKCLYCNKEATQKHHIIFRSQGGSDSPYNIAYLCFDCHFHIHHGKDIQIKNWILEKCYAQLKGHYNEVWKGRIKPKIVNILEST